jgi:surface protein
MCDGCNKLEELDISNFNISKIASMTYVFSNCTELKSLNLSGLDTHHITSINNICSSCYKLKTILGKIDLYSVTSLQAPFSSCTALEDITLTNIRASLNLGSCSALTNDTLINTFKELWDLTGGTSKTLTLSTKSKENIANIYVKLITPTQEQIDADPYINNKKPCVVCESTDDGAMTLTEYATSKNWAIA